MKYHTKLLVPGPFISTCSTTVGAMWDSLPQLPFGDGTKTIHKHDEIFQMERSPIGEISWIWLRWSIRSNVAVCGTTTLLSLLRWVIMWVIAGRLDVDPWILLYVIVVYNIYIIYMSKFRVRNYRVESVSQSSVRNQHPKVRISVAESVSKTILDQNIVDKWSGWSGWSGWGLL